MLHQQIFKKKIKLQITTKKKMYSRLAIGWNVLGFHELGLFWQVPQSNYDQKKKIQSSSRWFECLGGSMSSDCSSNYNRKKGTVIWPSVGMFGGLHEVRLLIKLRPKKKVQSSGHRLVCLGGSIASRLLLAGRIFIPQNLHLLTHIAFLQ